MRIVYMIICLAAISMTLIVIRSEEVKAQQQIQALQRRMVDQRRQLWHLDATLGELKSVMAVNVRAEEMELSLVSPDHRGDQLEEVITIGLSDNLRQSAGNNNPSGSVYIDMQAQSWRPSGGGG